MFQLSQKGQFYVQPRLDNDRADIKKEMLQRFLMPKTHERTEQPKLLPGRKPIIQLDERAVLQSTKFPFSLN